MEIYRIIKTGAEVVARIETRAAEWAMVPVTHQEQLHVLRYAEGQQYKDHHDAFDATTAADSASRAQSAAFRASATTTRGRAGPGTAVGSAWASWRRGS